jgi:hypothetical protein
MAEPKSAFPAGPMLCLTGWMPRRDPHLHRFGQRADGSRFDEPPRFDPTIGAAVDLFRDLPFSPAPPRRRG